MPEESLNVNDCGPDAATACAVSMRNVRPLKRLKMVLIHVTCATEL